MELVEFEDYGSDLDESNTIEENYKQLPAILLKN